MTLQPFSQNHWQIGYQVFISITQDITSMTRDIKVVELFHDFRDWSCFAFVGVLPSFFRIEVNIFEKDFQNFSLACSISRKLWARDSSWKVPSWID